MPIHVDSCQAVHVGRSRFNFLHFCNTVCESLRVVNLLRLLVVQEDCAESA
jgi:hypothetical protein